MFEYTSSSGANVSNRRMRVRHLLYSLFSSGISCHIYLSRHILYTYCSDWKIVKIGQTKNPNSILCFVFAWILVNYWNYPINDCNSRIAFSLNLFESVIYLKPSEIFVRIGIFFIWSLILYCSARLYYTRTLLHVSYITLFLYISTFWVYGFDFSGSIVQMRFVVHFSGYKNHFLSN